MGNMKGTWRELGESMEGAWREHRGGICDPGRINGGTLSEGAMAGPPRSLHGAITKIGRKHGATVQGP